MEREQLLKKIAEFNESPCERSISTLCTYLTGFPLESDDNFMRHALHTLCACDDSDSRLHREHISIFNKPTLSIGGTVHLTLLEACISRYQLNAVNYLLQKKPKSVLLPYG